MNTEAYQAPLRQYDKGLSCKAARLGGVPVIACLLLVASARLKKILSKVSLRDN